MSDLAHNAMRADAENDEPKESAIEQLRNLVQWYGWCNETWNEQWSVRELVAIWNFADEVNIDAFPDEWPLAVINAALMKAGLDARPYERIVKEWPWRDPFQGYSREEWGLPRSIPGTEPLTRDIIDAETGEALEGDASVMLWMEAKAHPEKSLRAAPDVFGVWRLLLDDEDAEHMVAKGRVVLHVFVRLPEV